VQRRLGGCNVAQNGAAFPSGKMYVPGGPNSGQKGCILFLEYFFIFGGAAKLRWAGGAQRPVWRVFEPKKSVARSARARTSGQNPLVREIIIIGEYFKTTV
jgi:hypothetical protein